MQTILSCLGALLQTLTRYFQDFHSIYVMLVLNVWRKIVQ